MNTLKDRKVVLITGAGSGIGKACALHLARIGVEVIAGVRKSDDGVRLREEAGMNILPVLIDITSAESIGRAVEVVSKSLMNRGLSGLVNCAGIPMGGPLEFLRPERLRQVLEVNLIGHLSMIQAFLALIRKANGRIVNMGSISGLVSFPFVGPYAASKYGLEAITDALRMELKPWNINVSIIEPGDVATPIWEKTSAVMKEIIANSPPEALKLYGPAMKLVDKIAIHGIPPERVADAVTHALLARRPKLRYRLGRDAKMALFLRYLPTSIRDRIILWQMPVLRMIQ